MLFRKKKKQKTFIYCPKCNTELISTHSFVEERLFYTYFGCKKCGAESMWDFNTPTPILMHWYDIGSRGINFLNIEEECKMANAKKCDRCGKYYDKSEFRLEKQNSNMFAINEDIDLCKDCCENFNKWLSGTNVIES